MNTLFFNCILKRMPILKNSVCFKSFYGLYNDNPKYISEELHKKYPNITIYWIIDKNKCNTFDVPNYVKCIPAHSIRKLFIQNMCSVIVDNLAGWYNDIVPKEKLTLMMHMKNSKIFNISTWHGTPKKRIGLDAYNNNNLSFFTTSDLIVDNSEYNRQIFTSCFENRMPILIAGTPRNDILVNMKSLNREDVQNKLQLPKDKKIAIYAPTYRQIVTCENDSFNDYMYGLDVKNLLNSLSKRFGDDWVLVFRGHQFDQGKDSFKQYLRVLENVIDGNVHDDMAEYLSVADVLITDYSGSMFDFSLTNRPCFLYTPDKDSYEHSERGVYDVQLPYDYCITNEQLADSIRQFNQKDYDEKLAEFKSRLGLQETGEAASAIVDIIIKHLKQ